MIARVHCLCRLRLFQFAALVLLQNAAGHIFQTTLFSLTKSHFCASKMTVQNGLEQACLEHAV